MQGPIDPARHELPLAARDALARLLARALREPGADAALAGALAIARLPHGAALPPIADAGAARTMAASRPAAGAAAARGRAALLAAGLLMRADDPQAADGERSSQGRAGAALVRACPPWDATAVGRLELYARAAADAPRGRSRALALEQSRRLFALDLPFEVHEVLEPVWREAYGTARRLLQGVIQAAVARHHAARGNRSGALRLARAAREKLAGAPCPWEGFPLDEVDRCTRALEEHLAGEEDVALPAPPFASRDRG